MKALATLLTLALAGGSLTGCGLLMNQHSSYTNSRYPDSSPEKRRQCEYQAAVATAGYTRIDDSAIAAWKRLELIDMCMGQQ